MPADATPALLAYVAYIAWLVAGLGDFLCHRRTDLPRTWGLAESRLHLLQLALIGGSIVLALAFAASAALAAALCVAVLAHAVFGYLDTRSAFAKRVILPVEQHVHSLLDMAPLIALFLGWSRTGRRSPTAAAFTCANRRCRPLSGWRCWRRPCCCAGCRRRSSSAPRGRAAMWRKGTAGE